MRNEEPSPSGDLKPSTFFIGRDSRGRWVAQDADRLRGGLFISRAAAVKFAMHESGHRADTIVPLSHIIELDFGAGAQREIPSLRSLSHAA